jgi:protein-S-isoprenylcysteine O-methyltransferase Ste14
MGKKTDEEVFFESMPDFKIWHKVIILYAFQIILFALVIFFYYWTSSNFWYGAIAGQTIVSTLLVFHFIYLANKADKIGVEYRRKYGKYAIQKFWYNYQSYTIPIICIAFYFPLSLIKMEFLPTIIPVPDHFVNNIMLPFFVSIPIGLVLIYFGLMIKKRSREYSADVDNYLNIVYPEKSRLITKNVYKYIRNPQYLARGLISIGFGFIANTLSAVIVGLIHFLSYIAIIPAEDNELGKRFGDEFKKYRKEVPMLLPRYGNWKNFVGFIFIGKK